MGFISIVALALTSLPNLSLARPQGGVLRTKGWEVNFYNDKCTAPVSPTRAGGYGISSCQRVSGADCISGGMAEYSGLTICAYNGENCDGWSTILNRESPRGQANIVEDGGVLDINSFKVVDSAAC